MNGWMKDVIEKRDLLEKFCCPGFIKQFDLSLEDFDPHLSLLSIESLFFCFLHNRGTRLGGFKPRKPWEATRFTASVLVLNRFRQVRFQGTRVSYQLNISRIYSRIIIGKSKHHNRLMTKVYIKNYLENSKLTLKTASISHLI